MASHPYSSTYLSLFSLLLLHFYTFSVRASYTQPHRHASHHPNICHFPLLVCVSYSLTTTSYHAYSTSKLIVIFASMLTLPFTFDPFINCIPCPFSTLRAGSLPITESNGVTSILINIFVTFFASPFAFLYFFREGIVYATAPPCFSSSKHLSFSIARLRFLFTDDNFLSCVFNIHSCCKVCLPSNRFFTSKHINFCTKSLPALDTLDHVAFGNEKR